MEISLVVDRVAYGGQGMGRLENGKVCFVPRVIPGERVTAVVRKERASYAEADLAAVLEPSSDRIEPVCPVFGRCGGCHYQHVNYARQLVFKQEQVADVLRRIGGQKNPPVEATVASPHDFHYRNRITVHVKDGRVGFYAPGSRKIVEITQCPIATEQVNGMLSDLRTSRPADGEYPLREPGEFRGFRQINDAIAGRLLEVVEEMAAPGGGLLVDAYCGAGFFAKRLSAMFHMTIGIEWSADAVRAAREGVGDSEIYLLGDVKRHLVPALGAGAPETTTLLLDPPAEGLDAETIGVVLERQPARIIYVSCNPSTLARDLKRLSGAYGLRRVRPVDMFPQTAEIESASLLEKL